MDVILLSASSEILFTQRSGCIGRSGSRGGPPPQAPSKAASTTAQVRANGLIRREARGIGNQERGGRGRILDDIALRIRALGGLRFRAAIRERLQAVGPCDSGSAIGDDE